MRPGRATGSIDCVDVNCIAAVAADSEEAWIDVGTLREVSVLPFRPISALDTGESGGGADADVDAREEVVFSPGFVVDDPTIWGADAAEGVSTGVFAPP